MKFWKIVFTLLLICFLSTFLYSCTYQEDNLKLDFVKYCTNKSDNNTFITSANTKMVVVGLDKESKSRNPKCVLTIAVGNSDINKETYDWLQLSIDERKAELKECGDKVVEYAKENNWSNDYYLYVKVCQVYDGCNIVYDYETDDIWIPNCENTFLSMYKKFNTFYKKDIAKTQSGIEFLTSNKLANVKHGEIEYITPLSYTVNVSNGKFDSFGKEHSTLH